MADQEVMLNKRQPSSPADMRAQGHFHPSQRGLTLVEIMIALAIVAALLAAGLPAFRTMILNGQIRAVAESVQAGVTLARSEAVRRNAPMRFQFVDNLTASCALSTTSTTWMVSLRDVTGRCDIPPTDDAPSPNPVTKSFANNASRASVVVASGASFVTFTPLGQASSALQIDINATSASGTCAESSGDARCLRVLVSIGGQTRMCDPARTGTVANPDPMAC
jgi:type IV fimbrial biogenesis protein FimT